MNSQLITTNTEIAKARHQIALLGSETNQQLSLRVQDVVPGEGTPLHIHTEQAETFHVVSGTFRFRVNDDEIVGEPGFTVHIPKGTPHAFLYEGQTQNGQLISILTPGKHDGFIQNIPEAQAAGASMDELTNMAEAYGAKIIGPRLQAKA